MDRFNLNSQLEHLQSKYVGTGHADTNKFEWLVNQHRDSYASYIGHHALISYFSVAQNECIARVKFEFIEKMLQPCGMPVPRDE
ncbi:splicing factor 3B subunit 5/RDS3 complex subunit 10 [Gigaspora rosea]|uniref:Splicing factor subunit n=2 Tax=Gigaspora TaxID=4873 RepID=A0A397VX29_9GLOM|nr:splicing factor 3B subunit 5/RDS3 complex subunit 10 [Gigaspora margarita]RIB26498.1 splicing factor 3B subunit 5/RDS3 complex subunit 10 [Gigaspora rosea]